MSNSRLCTFETKPLFEKCFIECLEQIFKFLDKENIDYKNAFAVKKECEENYSVFKKIIYRPSINFVKGTIVKINENEVYEYKSDMMWIQKSSEKLDSAVKNLVGYISRCMEARIRKIFDFEPKKLLSIDTNTVISNIPETSPNKEIVLKIIKDTKTKALIEKTTMKYIENNNSEFELLKHHMQK